MSNKTILALALGVGLVAAVVAVLVRPQSDQDSSNQVAATIYPIYDIAKNIAPDDIGVSLILPDGASPHSYEPTPSKIRELSSVKVVYAVGHGFDSWANSVSTSANAEMVTVDKGVSLIEKEEADQDHHEEAEHHEETESIHGHDHGPTDPHYWLSINNAKAIAQTIASDLGNRYAEHREEINTNLERYLKDLDEADTSIRKTLAEVENRKIVTLHDAWHYFADSYDLTIVGTFEPSGDREPSAQQLRRLTDTIKEQNIRIIYSEPGETGQDLKVFTQDNNLSIVELNPLEGSFGAQSYIDGMIKNAQNIRQNQ